MQRIYPNASTIELRLDIYNFRVPFAFLYLVIPHHLHRPIRGTDRGQIRLRLAIGLGIHRLARLGHSGRQLEVLNVVSQREGVDGLGLVVEGVGESVRRARLDDDVVARWRRCARCLCRGSASCRPS